LENLIIIKNMIITAIIDVFVNVIIFIINFLLEQKNLYLKTISNALFAQSNPITILILFMYFLYFNLNPIIHF